jgi:hypothetical protein
VVQILLALATTGIVFLIGRRVYGPAVGSLAAAICWLYPSLVFSNFLILTETLFTFLLMAFVLLMVMLVQSPRALIAVAGGATLALAALTRSVLWPAPLILCPLLFLVIRGPLRTRVTMPLLVLTAFVVVLGPWSIRNTRLQGVFTTVDTMGGLNLRMGNYEYTPEDRMWDAVSLTGERSWVYALSQEHVKGPITEGFKDKWAQRKAVEYMREHPGQTLKRSIIKFADFWGLEREFMAGVRDGFFSPQRWFAIVAALAIIGGYVAVSLLGAAGLWLERPPDWRTQVMLLFPVVLITGAHTIVFGHSRYHLPLMPLFGIWAAAVVESRLSDVWFQPRLMVAGAVVSMLLLCTIWARQIVFVDAARLAEIFRSAGL